MGLVGAEVMQSAMMIGTLPADVPEQYQTVGQAWLWRPRGHSQSLEASKLASDRATPASKTASVKRRNSGARRLPLRKSRSERPLLVSSSSDHRLCDAMATASLQDVALECEAASASSRGSDLSTVSTSDLSETDARRLEIMTRAEEIMRGKQCVGFLDGATCPVCLVDDVDTQLSACGHLLHAKCIKRWIQKSSRCPVCREEVVGVTEAYASPTDLSFRPMEKDRLTHSTDATLLLTPDEERDGDDDSFGWFEDFDELDEADDDCAGGMLFSERRSLPTFPSAMHSSSSSLASNSAPHMLMNRQLSATFEVCRTFQPLRAGYDTPYQSSRHEWLRAIPSHRHIAAKIQIRSFRIVESKASGDRHAEYLIELQLDGRVYVSKWRRFSEIARFANKLNADAYRQSLELWAPIEASSRWFNRLELSYLHERCRMIEEFAHALLLESSNAHKLADFVECC